MADVGRNQLVPLFEEAVRRHDTYFKNAKPPGRKLTKVELEAYKGRYEVGWQIVLSIGGDEYPLNVLLNSQYPFSKPKIALVDKTKYGQWPHVETDGGLCLLDAQSSTVITVGPDLVNYLLHTQTVDLICKCKSGENREDFLTEFASYWPDNPLKQKPIWSLLDVETLCQTAICWQGKDFILVGHNKKQLQVWLKNYFGQQALVQKGFSKALSLWVEYPPFPEQYPKSNVDFAKFIKNERADTYVFFVNEFPTDQPSCLTLFSFISGNSPFVTGVWVKRSEKKLEKGFRSGRTPQKTKVLRYLGNQKDINHIAVQRIDHDWVHTRGGRNPVNFLLNKKVAIIGCGSVGSLVAETLAKAGVGQFLFFDFDRLSWDNIARHALGGEYIDRFKAEAMAEYLSKNFPHLGRHAKETTKWESCYINNSDLFAGCDIIISTIGEWPSESLLNYLQRSVSNFPPVLYGWTEAHACAGHGLLVKNVGGCFACGMDNLGNFQHTTIEWGQQETMKRAPACGAFYQPYGITDLLPIISMVANLALQELSGEIDKSLHYTWLVQKKQITSHGAKLTPYYMKKHDDDMAKMITEEWPLNKDCCLCV